MELAPLTTGIDVGWQVAQQRPIELAAREAGIETPRVDAREARAQTAIDHLLGELIGRNPPDREERLESAAGELLLAIPTNVLEKQIAEGRVRKSVRRRIGDRRPHLRFVDVVRT